MILKTTISTPKQQNIVLLLTDCDIYSVLLWVELSTDTSMNSKKVSNENMIYSTTLDT